MGETNLRVGIVSSREPCFFGMFFKQFGFRALRSEFLLNLRTKTIARINLIIAIYSTPFALILSIISRINYTIYSTNLYTIATR